MKTNDNKCYLVAKCFLLIGKLNPSTFHVIFLRRKKKLFEFFSMVSHSTLKKDYASLLFSG